MGEAGGGEGAGAGAGVTASAAHAGGAGAATREDALGHALGPCWIKELKAQAPLQQRRRRRRRRQGATSDVATGVAHGAGRGVAPKGGSGGPSKAADTGGARARLPVRMIFDDAVAALRARGERWTPVEAGGEDGKDGGGKDVKAGSHVGDTSGGDDWPLQVLLSSGEVVGCDFIVRRAFRLCTCRWPPRITQYHAAACVDIGHRCDTGSGLHAAGLCAG